jgi:AbrB family looped-hinge helix DNA binding protein
MKATVGEPGQITIAKPVRDRLGPRPGQRAEVTDEGGRVILAKIADDDPIQRIFGTLTIPGCVDEIVDEMRGPAVLPA